MTRSYWWYFIEPQSIKCIHNRHWFNDCLNEDSMLYLQLLCLFYNRRFFLRVWESPNVTSVYQPTFSIRNVILMFRIQFICKWQSMGWLQWQYIRLSETRRLVIMFAEICCFLSECSIYMYVDLIRRWWSKYVRLFRRILETHYESLTSMWLGSGSWL